MGVTPAEGGLLLKSNSTRLDSTRLDSLDSTPPDSTQRSSSQPNASQHSTAQRITTKQNKTKHNSLTHSLARCARLRWPGLFASFTASSSRCGTHSSPMASAAGLCGVTTRRWYRSRRTVRSTSGSGARSAPPSSRYWRLNCDRRVVEKAGCDSVCYVCVCVCGTDAWRWWGQLSLLDTLTNSANTGDFTKRLRSSKASPRSGRLQLRAARSQTLCFRRYGQRPWTIGVPERETRRL